MRGVKSKGFGGLDVFDKKTRSKIMSRVKQKDTKPEMIVRRILHGMSYRFRLHRKDLPGKPDIVLPKYKAVIFVYGCFWHGHDCPRGKLPGTRREFWENKISGNRERDLRVEKELEALGYRIAIVWQCRIKDKEELSTELRQFLDGGAGHGAKAEAGRSGKTASAAG